MQVRCLVLAEECSWSGSAQLLLFFYSCTFDRRTEKLGPGLCDACFVCWHNWSRLDESRCETCCQHAFLLITFVASLCVSQINKDVREDSKTHIIISRFLRLPMEQTFAQAHSNLLFSLSKRSGVKENLIWPSVYEELLGEISLGGSRPLFCVCFLSTIKLFGDRFPSRKSFKHIVFPFALKDWLFW